MPRRRAARAISAARGTPTRSSPLDGEMNSTPTPVPSAPTSTIRPLPSFSWRSAGLAENAKHGGRTVITGMLLNAKTDRDLDDIAALMQEPEVVNG